MHGLSVIGVAKEKHIATPIRKGIAKFRFSEQRRWIAMDCMSTEQMSTDMRRR